MLKLARKQFWLTNS